MRHGDVFADIFNVLVFKKKIFTQDNFTECSERGLYLKDSNYKENERDVVKKCKDFELTLATLGIENQTKNDKNMPVRVMGYDYCTYQNQKITNEQPNPVITIVLSFSMEGWNEPKSLMEMFEEQGEIMDELREYINDYKIHVIDVPMLPKEVIETFESDFKYVARWAKGVKNGHLEPLDYNIVPRHVDEVLALITALSGSDEFKKMYKKIARERKDVTMCEALQKLIDSGVERGIECGIEQGEIKGRLTMLEQLVSSGYLTEEIAAEQLGITKEEYLLQIKSLKKERQERVVS